MCGRYALHGPKTRKLGDKLSFRGAAVEFAPRYNIPPMQDLPVYCIDAEGAPQLTLMRWGFLPAWARELKPFTPPLHPSLSSPSAHPSAHTLKNLSLKKYFLMYYINIIVTVDTTR